MTRSGRLGDIIKFISADKKILLIDSLMIKNSLLVTVAVVAMSIGANANEPTFPKYLQEVLWAYEEDYLQAHLDGSCWAAWTHRNRQGVSMPDLCSVSPGNGLPTKCCIDRLKRQSILVAHACDHPSRQRFQDHHLNYIRHGYSIGEWERKEPMRLSLPQCCIFSLRFQ
jgi:hypothetical protein